MTDHPAKPNPEQRPGLGTGAGDPGVEASGQAAASAVEVERRGQPRNPLSSGSDAVMQSPLAQIRRPGRGGRRQSDGDNPAALLEAALNALDKGVAVLDARARVVIWNSAAAAMTGYTHAELLLRPLPENLFRPDAHHQARLNPASATDSGLQQAGPEGLTFVHLLHHRGHTLPAMLRATVLRDDYGARCGSLLRFHPAEEIDTLPHGTANGSPGVEHSQADLEDRLEEAFREWTANGTPCGLLWITIDQGALLRRTHGRDACDAMLTILETTLLHGLRPAEILGRWGENEFLVLAHERTAPMLAAHAEHVALLARMAEFRWWGDRVRLTVSIGAAQAAPGESLAGLLRRAQRAMSIRFESGGDGVSTCDAIAIVAR